VRAYLNREGANVGRETPDHGGLVRLGVVHWGRSGTDHRPLLISVPPIRCHPAYEGLCCSTFRGKAREMPVRPFGAKCLKAREELEMENGKVQ
jgi:hypothetical protein